ncbi:MAG: TadE family protein [Syntrophomonadaceae bacterium]
MNRLMKRQMAKVLNIIHSERGSFTIEATLVFPMVFLVVIALLFFSLYSYQKVLVYYQASTTTERAAFIWNNSHRNGTTGALGGTSGGYLNIMENNDGLYWRLYQDGSYSSSLSGAGGSIQGQKFNQVLKDRNFSGTGTISYNNYFVVREMKMEMNKKIAMPNLFGMPKEAIARTRSTTTDPVEFIRTVDFMYSYMPTVVKRATAEGSGGQAIVSKAKDFMQQIGAKK